MSSAILVLCSFMMCMFLMCAVMLFILVKRSKKKKTIGSAGAVPAAGTAPVNNVPGAAPLYKTSAYNGSLLLSSSVATVKGLSKNAAPSVYGDIRFIITRGSPAVASGLKQRNRAYSRSDTKKMLAVSLNDAWPAMKVHFGFEDWQKDRVLALFIGQATKESTIRVDIETGTDLGYGKNPAHAYGALQTAVTAFKGSAELYNYMAEGNVPEMKWYDWTPENFYDPMISNFMGFRKMCNQAIRAKSENKATDPRDILRRALKGFNTGHPSDVQKEEDWLAYAYQIGKMGEWYYKKGHMTDEAFTWSNNYIGNADSFGTPASGGQWAQNFEWIWKK